MNFFSTTFPNQLKPSLYSLHALKSLSSLISTSATLTGSPIPLDSNNMQYKSQICLSVEYCSHVRGRAPKSTLYLLDKVQSKAIRLISNSSLSKSLQPLSHRRLVGDLSRFYRYFHGNRSQKIRNITSAPPRHLRATRSSTHSHPFHVSMPYPLTLSHKSSFIPRKCNVLSFSCFPQS